MPTVEISERTLARIKQLAGPLFSPADVIDRLVLAAAPGNSVLEPRVAKELETPRQLAAVPRRGLDHRRPRERGATVVLGGKTINAASVRDLFEQALKHLVDGGAIARLDPLLPYRTSNQRYLIARKPVHPTGNSFVAPAQYKGYYMESHKNYRNAVGGLALLAAKAGVSFEYYT